MEINPDNIKEIIQNNCHNMAFIIGNGIHYQYKDCDISWNDLLTSLWEECFGEKLEIPQGISTTEFFDIIEMNFYKNSNYVSNPNKIKSHTAKITDLQDVKSDDLVQIMFKFASKSSNTNIVNYNAIEEFREKHEKFVENCRRWCEANIEDTTNLTNENCVFQVLDVLSNGTKKQILTNAIKKTVAKKFPSKERCNLEKCIQGIKKLNTPILTTNFDTYISEYIEKTELKILKNGQYKFTDFYPWNMCYSDKSLENPLDGFAVWHINGIVKYPRSIRLGLSDYMGCVERARKMIQGTNLNEYFSGKNQVGWKGYNTWLHIIFNKSLFIFGLGLEENEVFLRWLLIQRAKYFRMYNKTFGGWYVDKEIKVGKRFFLEQLGFEVIDISDYKTLYQALETL